MSRRENPYDNAHVESFFKTLKHEEIFANDYSTIDDLANRLPHFLEELYNRSDRPPIVVPPTVLVQPPPEAWGEGRRVSGVSGRPDRAGSLPEPGAGSPESYEDGWCCTRAATVR